MYAQTYLKIRKDTLFPNLSEQGPIEDEDEECPPCEPDEPKQPGQTEAERVAAVFFEEVREVSGWSTKGAPPSAPLAVLRASHNGCAGGLLLCADAVRAAVGQGGRPFLQS